MDGAIESDSIESAEREMPRRYYYEFAEVLKQEAWDWYLIMLSSGPPTIMNVEFRAPYY